RILLCHNPDVFAAAAAWGIDLVLSGHTHGGQVCLPGFGPILLPIRSGRTFSSGTHRIGSSTIHITRGVGVVAPPVRVNCPPEVSLLTLEPLAVNAVA
ncbi:MAG: metallophosphoesterase, partial [Candidatus Eisenbacteria bacterium]|nr:metallophosphoesterase [Candidatus Eisenbacteria bacterium]